MLIAPMEEREADRVTELFKQVLNDLPYYSDLAKVAEAAKYTAAKLRQAAVEDPEAILIAKIDAQLVGFCFSEQDDTLVWLSWFGVHPQFRRMGVGGAMLRRLDQRAQSLGAHKVWCDCRTNNSPSKLTLTSHEYEPICTIRNHWYGQDFILWQKSVG